MPIANVVRRDPDKAYIDRYLWVPKAFISVEGIKAALTYEVASTYAGTVRVEYLWRETDNHLLVPRAYWRAESLPCTVVDCRPRAYQEVDFSSKIRLDHGLKELPDGRIELLPTGDVVQRRSIEALENSTGGILQLACGKGKTTIALEKIARGRVPALVMLDTTQLLYQWHKAASELLTVPGGIGVFGDGKHEWRKGLVLATYHSVANWADAIPSEARRWFGQIFWDEGHHCPAPLFSKTAAMFYGTRYSLTATPERDDGLHVIAEGHIGPVLYKDLTPTMQPIFAFYWSGLRVDLTDARVAAQVVDAKKELHIGKTYAHFGRWRTRLDKLLELVREARACGRTVLVLSNSVDEVINLMTLWEDPSAQLFTEMPPVTPADVGEQLNPVELTGRQLGAINRRIGTLETKIKRATGQTTELEAELALCKQALAQHAVALKIAAEYARRQKAFIKALLKKSTTSGMLTYSVSPELQQEFIRTKSVIFSITKYGKEGMNCPRLDTVILSALFSKRASLQQLMGRPTRPVPGKKQPVLLAVVDDVPHLVGMAKKLVTHLQAWPADEGGPYPPQYVGFPSTWRVRARTDTETLFKKC